MMRFVLTGWVGEAGPDGRAVAYCGECGATERSFLMGDVASWAIEHDSRHRREVYGNA